MSFSTVASYSSDKGPDLCGQSSEDLGADFFEQFLTFDPSDNERHNLPNLPKSTHLVKSTGHSTATGTPSSSPGTDGNESTGQDSGWNWALGQTATSSHHTHAPGSQLYSVLSERAANSDSELLSLDNFTLGSPFSPLSPPFRASSLSSRTSTPPTASTIARRRAPIKQSTTKLFKKAHSFDKSLRTPIQKSRTSPKMVLGPQKFDNELDARGNKVNSKFVLDFEHPLSPPQSARVSDASSIRRFVGDNHEDFMSYSNGLPHQFTSRASGYDTPLATPVLDGQHSRKTSSQNPFADNMGLPPTPQFHQGSGVWSQGSSLSEFNTYGTPAIQTPETEPALWWNHAASAPMAQPSPTALHFNARRGTKSLAHQLQNGLPYQPDVISSTAKIPSGLMIQMPNTGAQRPFVLPPPHMQSPPAPRGYFSHPPPTHPYRHQYPPPTRSCVPAMVAHPQHPSTMRRTPSSARCDKRVDESPSPKTKASSSHVGKRRTTRASKNATKTPTAGGVDFVNFTPDDSTKILTGVAPSGSSKTKARREMEAMEKRRNLSMAALRAVRAAGGDVDSLVQQGLFV